MIVEPAALPNNNPVELLMVALVVSLLVQTPPGVELPSWLPLPFIQATLVPVIGPTAGMALTVTVAVEL